MAEVLALVTQVYTIFGAITKIYDAIHDIKNLPKTFLEIRNKLALVESILKAAEEQLKKHQPDPEKEKQVKDVVHQCLKKTQQLHDISKVIADHKDAGAWPTIKRFYKDAIRRLGKLSKNRVEDQMKEIWEGLQTLAILIQLGTFGQLGDLSEQMESAIKTLSEIANEDPSLSKEESEESAFTMSVSEHGQGIQAGQIKGDVSRDSYGPSLAAGPGSTAWNVGNADFIREILKAQGKV